MSIEMPDWKHEDLHRALIKAIVAAIPDETDLKKVSKFIRRMVAKKKSQQELTMGLLLILSEGVISNTWPWDRKKEKA